MEENYFFDLHAEACYNVAPAGFGERERTEASSEKRQLFGGKKGLEEVQL